MRRLLLRVMPLLLYTLATATGWAAEAQTDDPANPDAPVPPVEVVNVYQGYIRAGDGAIAPWGRRGDAVPELPKQAPGQAEQPAAGSDMDGMQHGDNEPKGGTP